jgi:hypothetical protein
MMYRYIGISIVALLLLAGCVEPPRPIPIVVPGATARSLPATPTLTLTPPSRSTTLAEVSPTIAASPTSTVFPSITPTVTVSPPAPPPPTFSPARTPTRTPTPRPPRKPTSRPAGAPAPSPAPVAKPSAAPPPGAAWYGEYFANPDRRWPATMPQLISIGAWARPVPPCRPTTSRHAGRALSRCPPASGVFTPPPMTVCACTWMGSRSSISGTRPRP